MKEENKNGQSPEKEQLLSSLRNAEEMYVFMSLCTKMPYVLCDEETFDDEVLLYYTEEDAQREGKKLIEQRLKRNSCLDFSQACIRWASTGF